MLPLLGQSGGSIRFTGVVASFFGTKKEIVIFSGINFLMCVRKTNKGTLGLVFFYQVARECTNTLIWRILDIG